MVPSWTGSSYFLPVRLSTIEIVSAIDFRLLSSNFRLRTVVVPVLVLVDRFVGDAVGAVGPAGQILQLASLTAERPPFVFDRVTPAQDAERLRHQPMLTRGARCEVRGARCEVRGAGARCGCGQPPSAAWWRTSLARTMKITSSATLVAWSPIRSRCRETRMRSRAGSIVEGSASM